MRRTTTALYPSPIRRWAGVLAAASLWAAASVARADDIGITTHNVQAAPGGTATVLFDFNFASNPTLASLELHLNFDKSLLSLTQNSVTYHGAAVDPGTAFGAAFSANPSDPAGFSALWISATDADVLTLSGSGTWAFSYQLLPALSAPGSTPVSMFFSFANAALDNGTVNGLATPVPVSSVIGVSAVPEPESWALMLCGMSLLALIARRRAGHASA